MPSTPPVYQPHSGVPSAKLLLPHLSEGPPPPFPQVFIQKSSSPQDFPCSTWVITPTALGPDLVFLLSISQYLCFIFSCAYCLSLQLEHGYHESRNLCLHSWVWCIHKAWSCTWHSTATTEILAPRREPQGNKQGIYWVTITVGIGVSCRASQQFISCYQRPRFFLSLPERPPALGPPNSVPAV